MRLNVAMVCLDSVNYLAAFLVLTCNVNTDLNVRAVDLVCHRLTDIVQKTCALSLSNVYAELARDHTCDMSDLDRVLKHVLTVARTVFKSTKQLNKLGIDTVYACFVSSLLAFFFDNRFDFLAALFHSFLDARGVDTSVGDELFESHSRNLSANGVKRRDSDCLGRIVDNKVNAGECFDSADISTLSTDDSSLHFVVGKVNNRYGRLCNAVCRTTLDSECDYVLGGFVCLVLAFLLDLKQLHRHFMSCFTFNALHKHSACFLGRHTRDFLKELLLLSNDSLDFCL